LRKSQPVWHRPVSITSKTTCPANRRGDGRKIEPDEFDNRSISFTSDFPSANFLASHGIQRVMLVQKNSFEPQSDLTHSLRRWQDGGLLLSA